MKGRGGERRGWKGKGGGGEARYLTDGASEVNETERCECNCLHLCLG